MLIAAATTWLMASATSYEMLLVGALGLGLSGGSFAVGTSYVSRWHSREQQGTALGIFGLGNIGTSLTHFLAPPALLAQIGSAHVCTPVTNAHLVCRLLLAEKKQTHAHALPS